MRILIFLSVFFCCSLQGAAQSWTGHSELLAGVTFDLPDGAQVYDSLHIRMYAVSVDSILGLQVHLFDSAYFNEGNELLEEALAQEGDTLRAIASLMLLATNSELVELEEVDVSGRNGLDVGLDYLTLASNIPTLTFCRYFLYDGKFLAFIISGSKDDETRLLNYKAAFFDSIKFD